MPRSLATILALLAAAQCHATDSAISAKLYVTDKGQELFLAWETNPVGGFTISPIKVARRGQFLSAVVLFNGCAPDKAGLCNALLDITAFDPSGKVYDEFESKELWVGKPAGAPDRTQLAVDYMGLVIEPNDPPGLYKVVAKARDLVSGKESVSEATFSVESEPK